MSADPGISLFAALSLSRGVVLPIYASEVEALGVQAESLRPVVYHRPLQAYANEDAPWVSVSSGVKGGCWKARGKKQGSEADICVSFFSLSHDVDGWLQDNASARALV